MQRKPVKICGFGAVVAAYDKRSQGLESFFNKNFTFPKHPF
jgi:hypothetical protein